MSITFIIFAILAYLLGSVSCAIIICRLAKLPDPRTMGSGNPGATNVLRMGDKKIALLVLLGDALKGFLAVTIASAFSIKGVELGFIGFFAFLGHLYPVYFQFKGGKGVATYMGVLLALVPILGLIIIAIWLTLAKVFKLSSLAALFCALVTPLLCWLLTPQYGWAFLVMSLFLIYRHQDNIKRLLKGKESEIENKKD